MSILLYGERGLVNAVVLEISDNIQLIKQVLGAVKLGDGRGFTWIDDIVGVDFWIEPSFGQFGNPDLITICHCNENQKYVIFFEAKIVAYEDSAMSLTKKYFPGINSCINAQLTLKYRFVKALQQDPKGVIIEESPNMTHAYAQLHTDDKQKDHRKLANDYIVSFCRKIQTDCKEAYFVALTADQEDVNIANFGPDLIPAVFDYHAINIWEQEKGKFGLLTFSQLASFLSSDGIFAETKKVVIPDLTPYKPVASAQVLRTINWNEFSQPIKDMRSLLQRLILQAADDIYGANQEIIKKYQYAGSDSYKGLGGNTILKIVPYKNQTDEYVILAVKESLVRAARSNDYFNEGPFRIGIGTKARDFYGHFFKSSEDELDQCQAYLTEIFNAIIN